MGNNLKVYSNNIFPEHPKWHQSHHLSKIAISKSQAPCMISYCQAESCTSSLTKCKWDCTVRARGSTALLPRKLNWKVCSRLSAGMGSLTAKSHHWQIYREIDGNQQQCRADAHDRVKKLFTLSAAAAEQQGHKLFTLRTLTVIQLHRIIVKQQGCERSALEFPV